MPQPTLNVLDAIGTPVVIYTINPNGRVAAVDSQPVTLCTEDQTTLAAISSSLSGSLIVTQATASNLNAQVVGPAASGTAKSGNPVQTGGVFNTSQPTVTNGQIVEAQSTARGARIVATGVDTFNVTVNTALPTGGNIIGRTGIDQTTPGTTNAVSLAQIGANTVATGNGASSTGVLRVAQVNDGTGVLATVTSLTQMNGQAIAMGTGVRSAGTQRVTIATDDVVPASQSGNWISRIVGNTGATIDSAPDATAPTNILNIGGRFVTSPATLTSGQAGSLQLTAAQNLKTDITTIAGTAAAVNNGTVSAGVQRVTLASDSSGNIATIGTSVTPGTGATHLGKAEDAAHASGDTGVMSLGVRTDTPASLGGTTGDYVPFQMNSTGYARVEQATCIFYNDSTSNQTNGTTLTGTARDTGFAAGTICPWNYFNFTVFNSHASTIRIEMSNDNSTWRAATMDVSVLAGVPQTISSPVVTRYYRIINVQGGTTSTGFMANSSFTVN